LLNGSPFELQAELSSLRHENTPFCPLSGFSEVSAKSG
jgi:hypothetical protein